MQRILCRYSRKKCKESKGICKKSDERRFRIGSNVTERIHRPVYE